MKYAMRDFHDGIETLLRDDNLKTVTVFCSPLSDVKPRIRVTRRQKDEIVVTFGKPNYSERRVSCLVQKGKVFPASVFKNKNEEAPGSKIRMRGLHPIEEPRSPGDSLLVKELN